MVKIEELWRFKKKCGQKTTVRSAQPSQSGEERMLSLDESVVTALEKAAFLCLFLLILILLSGLSVNIQTEFWCNPIFLKGKIKLTDCNGDIHVILRVSF